jgi:nitrite reductase/ring-hydroxylating ferredoxin subunit
MTASPSGPVAPDTQGVATPRSLTRSLLVVLLAISALLAATVVAFFLLPPPHLKVPDIRFVVRVARVEDFPVGTGRTVTSGERSVLVVRREQDAYFAVEGTASSDGCFLHWNPDALRIESPCTYVVYDLDGNVVEGLTRVPLRRYRVFERDGVLYIAES